MPERWVNILRDALRDECRDAPPILTLATTSADGRPRARSIVCRGIREQGEILMVSDARSEKNAELRSGPHAAAVFWLPRARKQFRIEGTVQVYDGTVPSAVRTEMWAGLSDASRALFFWPAPGALRTLDPAAFPREVADAGPPPTNFELLVLAAEQAEYLDLSVHPHARCRWRRAGGWEREEINP
jgi:pyridoxamine 5'-phosphate oxidase